VKQVKRFSLPILLMSFALVAAATPAFAQSEQFPDLDQRRLLGMGILALTLIIAFLMAWYLPMGPNGAGPRRWVSNFLRRTRRRQFNRDGAYGGLAYRGVASVAPSPNAKETAVLSPNGIAKAHNLPPSDESEVL
jgi:hypothetical protein